MTANVSVIIPSYNRANLLPGAIESVLRQTLPVFEIIVVDDGSVDSTREVCTNYPNVQYLYQKNQGVSAARNTGIRHSQGEYLIFLDSDDRLLPKAVEIGVHQLENYPEMGFVFGHCTFIDSNGVTLEVPPPELLKTASYKTILSGDHILAPAGRMVRRSAIDTAGLFLTNLGHGEDTEFWLRMARHFPIFYHQQAVFEYCVEDSSVAGTSTKISHQSAQMLLGLMHVLKIQKEYIQSFNDGEYNQAYERGKEFWINFYGPTLFHQIVNHTKKGEVFSALYVLAVMLLYYPQGLGVSFEYFHRLIRRATQFGIRVAKI